MTSKEIQAKVSDLLAEAEITYSVTFRGEGADPPTEKGQKPWIHDRWEIRFTRPGKPDFITEYKTGTRHRETKKAQFAPLSSHPVTGKLGRWQTKPVAPASAGVLASLCLDAQAGVETFEDFCADYGYDTDSRKALEIYLACQKIAGDAVRFFGGRLWGMLTKATEEY